MFKLPSVSTPTALGSSSFVLSKFRELPLISLGFHSLLLRARERLSSVVELAGIDNVLSALHPIHVDEKTSLLFLEMCEIVHEAPELIKSVKSCVLIANKSNDLEALFKSKKISTRLVQPDGFKKWKKPVGGGLCVVTGVEDPVLSLLCGILSGAANVCVRLEEFPFYKTALRLITIMSSLFASVNLYRPQVTTPLQNRGTVYVLATGRVKTEYDGASLFQEVAAMNGMHIVDCFTSVIIPKPVRDQVAAFNHQHVAKIIVDIERAYAFIQKKDFHGAQMESFKKNQQANSDAWIKKYAGRS